METGIETDFDGTFGLTAPDLGNSDFTTKAESLTWKGTIHYAGAEKSPEIITTDGLLVAGDGPVQAINRWESQTVSSANRTSILICPFSAS